jgi:hypothetical protein
MKKLILPVLLFSSLLFAGCLNPGPSTNNQPPANQENSTETRVFNNNEFSLNFPASWDVIQAKDFTSDIPSETQVVIRNNIKNEDFTANINVIKHSFQNSAKNSLDYGQEILNRQKSGLLNYRETKKEIVKRNIGGQQVDTYLVEFEAKLNQTDPILKFVQTFATKDNNGYTALGSYSQLENSIVINQVNQTVQSFQVN